MPDAEALRRRYASTSLEKTSGYAVLPEATHGGAERCRDSTETKPDSTASENKISSAGSATRRCSRRPESAPAAQPKAKNHAAFPIPARTGNEQNYLILPFVAAVARKRVLLIDGYATKRDLRSKIMRKLGVDVDCASDITQARALWRADAYSLVLVDVHNDAVNVQEFCDRGKGRDAPTKRRVPGGQAGLPCGLARGRTTGQPLLRRTFMASGAKW